MSYIFREGDLEVYLLRKEVYNRKTGLNLLLQYYIHAIIIELTTTMSDKCLDVLYLKCLLELKPSCSISCFHLLSQSPKYSKCSVKL